jgi:hypothetical protein
VSVRCVRVDTSSSSCVCSHVLLAQAQAEKVRPLEPERKYTGGQAPGACVACARA